MTPKAAFKIAGLLGLLLLTNNGWALPPLGGFLPGSTLPEQVGRGIQSQQPTTTSQVLPPVVNEPKKPPSGLASEAQKIKFQLNGIILQGNHVYSDAQLRPFYKDKLHKVITVAQLFQIVQDITNFYRNSGYVISRAILPPQHVKGGVVRVQIIEGYIGKVDVTGDPKGAKCLVYAFGQKIRECPPLAISRMEYYLLLANEIPGTNVKAVLAPSKKQKGAADLTLVTQNTLISGYVSYDNYGTRYIGPQQMTANFGLNSFAASGDTIQATMTKTPKGGELTYNDINYTLPIRDSGIRWLFGGTRTQTHPLFVLKPVQIDGINDNYYTTVTFPFRRTRTENLNMRLGFNYLDSHVTTFGTDLYTDHIRSLDVGATYNFTDRWYGANLISGDFRQGLPIFGYTSNTDPSTALTSRPGGRGDYTKIAAQASRLQALYGPLSLYGLLQGQWAFNPLLASEQFTFGGSQIGRGYDVAELIGDKGLSASLELRYDLAIGTVLQALQIYTYYDIGKIWNFKFVGGTPRALSGSTTGLGSRFYFTKYVSGNFMWTQTLTKEVAAEQLIGDGRRPRVFFSVVAALD